MIFTIKHYLRAILWKEISKLSSYGAVKGGIFYVGICGVASKSLSGLSNIQVGSQSVVLDLPFSWQILFFGTLCYIIGYILYLLFCPSFLKKYMSFVDLRNSGCTGEDLRYELEVINQSSINLPEHDEATISDVVFRLRTGSYEKVEYHDECSKLMVESIVNNDIDNSREVYNMISNSLENKYLGAKYLVLLLYVLSFCAVSFVFIQNILFVLRNIT